MTVTPELSCGTPPSSPRNPDQSSPSTGIREIPPRNSHSNLIRIFSVEAHREDRGNLSLSPLLPLPKLIPHQRQFRRLPAGLRPISRSPRLPVARDSAAACLPNNVRACPGLLRDRNSRPHLLLPQGAPSPRSRCARAAQLEVHSR